MTSPYTFEERILLGSQDENFIRAETFMSWNASNFVHPFGKLQHSLMDPLDDPSIQVTMSLASRSSQSLGIGSLQSVPLWNSDTLPQFPCGFRLMITSRRKLSELTLTRMIHHWMDQRIITTPLEGAVWDVEQTTGTETGVDAGTGAYHHQLMLPTNGAAWSADALHQSMHALLPCPNFMGVSAMEWSKLLVEGKTTNKQLWLQWSNGRATMGIQWQLLDVNQSTSADGTITTTTTTTTNLINEKPSCDLATRYIERVHSRASNMPIAKVDQVLRRPSTPNQGRLETWFTAELQEHQHQQHCQFQLRQRLPFFMEPQWRSLLITTDDKYQATVDWHKDWSTVLYVSSTSVPSSLIVSLDYEPVFLSFDDFPGDPNRGRDLPPAVVSILCDTGNISTSTTTTTQQQLYSNPIMILPPVPDMSMPFNVLSLSCSLYAYLIGTIITLLVKRASEKIKYQLHPEQKPKSKLQKIMAKFRKQPSEDQGVLNKGQEVDETSTVSIDNNKE